MALRLLAMEFDRGSRLIIGVGYLGLRLSRLWTAAGAKVYGTTRSHDRFNELRRLGIEPILWDVNEGGDALPAVDAAIYCVGYRASSGRSRREVYVEGLRHTLGQLSRPNRLIYISTTGVFGDNNGDWVDEETPPNPLDEAGQAAIEAEQTLWEFVRREEWDAVVLRLAGIYGPGRSINADRLRSGQPISGDPDGYLNLIHVEDAALIIDAAWRRASPGRTYLVSDGRPLTRRQFYSRLAESTGSPSPRFDPEAPARSRGSRRIANQKALTELVPAFRFRDSLVEMAHSMLHE